MMSLQKFLDAQDGIYETALQELRTGKKKSHWMWFILPQLLGLGRSATAHFYGISGLSEAKAYLAHPILGFRIRETVAVLLQQNHYDAYLIFGSPDDLKLKSCLTLFAIAEEEKNNIFRKALEVYFQGISDPRTVELLNR
ncbi:MAG: DUF1810 domain-containing protein [Kaistella sp.]